MNGTTSISMKANEPIFVNCPQCGSPCAFATANAYCSNCRILFLFNGTIVWSRSREIEGASFDGCRFHTSGPLTFVEFDPSAEERRARLARRQNWLRIWSARLRPVAKQTAQDFCDIAVWIWRRRLPIAFLALCFAAETAVFLLIAHRMGVWPL